MEKILVVDDIGANRRLLSKMLLAMGGYNVIEAVNGNDAVSLFEEQAPDLILMDINMPEMNGYESASAIKAITGDNYIPIIFVTASTAEASLTNALASGGDDFISKPFDMALLESKINAHLRIRELNKQINDKNKQLTNLNQNLIHEQELIEHFFVSALKQSFLDEKIIKYHMSSMSAFNGDLLLSERSPRGGMYLVMGDFTGHGLTAAMGTLPVALIFFEMAKKGLAVSEIAREINRQLNKLMPLGMFFAATLLEINAHGDIMSVWMGGMPECYWLAGNGELKNAIQSQHMPLGILKDNEFDDATEVYNIEVGDKLYLYSDGVTEAHQADGEMFGSQRLKDILISHGDNRFEQVLNELKAFTGISDQNDDITLVELTCHKVPAVEQDEEQINNDSFALHWEMSVSLSAKEMREDDPVEKISNMLGAIPSLARHKGVLHVLLSEMYSNALDHSILELSSLKKVDEEHFEDYYKERAKRLHALKDAFIVFDVAFFADRQCLQLRVKDSGQGYKGHISNDSDEMLHGRGLEIISGFCEEVSFSEEGRVLEVIYRL